MVENIIFKERSRGQTEIRVSIDSGEEIVMLFMSTYPLQVKEYCYKAINEILRDVKFPMSNVDLYDIMARGFIRVRLPMPFTLAILDHMVLERRRIGLRIKELREEKGMEARQLAVMAGIDAANLCRIEQGKYSVGIDVLSKISNVLGCKVDIVSK